MSWIKFDIGVGVVVLSSMVYVSKFWEDGPWWRRQIKRSIDLTVQSAHLSFRGGRSLRQYLHNADWLASMREPKPGGVVVPIKGWTSD